MLSKNCHIAALIWNKNCCLFTASNLSVAPIASVRYCTHKFLLCSYKNIFNTRKVLGFLPCTAVHVPRKKDCILS